MFLRNPSTTIIPEFFIMVVRMDPPGGFMRTVDP